MKTIFLPNKSSTTYFLHSLSEFGRSCKDIGCLPSEECTMSYASCSLRQQEGKDCGGYPTCMRKSASGIGSSVPGNNAKQANLILYLYDVLVPFVTWSKTTILSLNTILCGIFFITY